MSERNTKQYPITWTADVSQVIQVSDFRNIVITMVGTGNITVNGSADKEAVIDFTAASTISNSFAPIVLADLTVASTYTTNPAVSAATKILEINTNLLTSISITRSAGTVDAIVTICDNE